jgi:hypothetical protein
MRSKFIQRIDVVTKILRSDSRHASTTIISMVWVHVDANGVKPVDVIPEDVRIAHKLTECVQNPRIFLKFDLSVSNLSLQSF